jgi:DNA-binding CsgD family transcriptional regulator
VSWYDCATLFGATEAYCLQKSLNFFGEIWLRPPAPEDGAPWAPGEPPVGVAALLSSAVALYRDEALAPVADPEALTAWWVEGRALLFAVVVSTALTVDLSAPIETITDARVVAMPGVPARVRANPDALTRREEDVLALLCQRLTDPEIAERLFISPKTAGHHVSNILAKLGAANRREAAAIAARRGLI